MVLYPTSIQNSPTALQVLSQLLSADPKAKPSDPANQQLIPQAQQQQIPQTQNGGVSPVGTMIDNGLSGLFTKGAASATGLPWLSGGSASGALTALTSLLAL